MCTQVTCISSGILGTFQSLDDYILIYIYYFPAWNVPDPGFPLAWNLTSYPLQLKSSSQLGSREEIPVSFFNPARWINNLHIIFNDQLKITADTCDMEVVGEFSDTDKERIWTITKNEVFCDEVKLVLSALIRGREKGDLYFN